MRGDPCGQWQQDYQYPTGEIALREHYTRGILLKSEWFKPDGTHIQTTNWTNLSGESISLRSDGSVRVRASILHGLPDGEVVFFDESGAVERRQRYRNGAPLDSLWFDAAGTAHGTGSVDDLYPTPAQRRREHYVDGKLVRVEIFSPWNTLMMIVEHRDGGTEATYLNLDGTLQSWVRISIDRADSDKVAFDSEGKITQHSGTRCGIPFGP
jgi:antitoxin component YwqK of YwqJK toxin-antitoxin module